MNGNGGRRQRAWVRVQAAAWEELLGLSRTVGRPASALASEQVAKLAAAVVAGRGPAEWPVAGSGRKSTAVCLSSGVRELVAEVAAWAGVSRAQVATAAVRAAVAALQTGVH